MFLAILEQDCLHRPRPGTDVIKCFQKSQEPDDTSPCLPVVTRRAVGAGTITAIHGPFFRNCFTRHYPYLSMAAENCTWVCDRFVELADFYATALSLAGISHADAALDGADSFDMTPLLVGEPAPNYRDFAVHDSLAG